MRIRIPLMVKYPEYVRVYRIPLCHNATTVYVESAVFAYPVMVARTVGGAPGAPYELQTIRKESCFFYCYMLNQCTRRIKSADTVSADLRLDCVTGRRSGLLTLSPIYVIK